MKTTVLAALAGAMWLKMPRVTVPVKIECRLSLKCWILGHEDWIRRGLGRLYLECADWEDRRRFGEVIAYDGPRLTAPMLTRFAGPNPVS